MFSWANSRTAEPKAPLDKALTYLKNQWPWTKQEVMEMTQEQFEWLMSGQTIVPTIRKTKPKSMA